MTTKSITDKIIQIRKYKKLSQKDFACKTMISPSTLSEVESKKINPSSALLVGIANAFDDINIEWLLTGNGEMFKSEESESARMKIIDLIESLSEEIISKFAGKWIAVVNNKVAAYGDSFKEVYSKARIAYPKERPLVGKLPEANPVVLSIQ